MLPTIFWYFVKQIIYKYRHILDPYGIIDKATWVIYELFIFAFSFFCGAFLYFTLYQIYIPTLNQSANLYLNKIDTGYLARIYNSDGDFPICDQYSLYGGYVNRADLMSSKICANPVDWGRTHLDFKDENYEITAKFVVSSFGSNWGYIQSVPISTEFISETKQIIQETTEGIPKSEKYKFTNIANRALGLQEDLTLPVTLNEKLDNSRFHVNVINIDIQQPYVTIKSGKIETKIILSGLRGMMARWFWTSIFFGVSILTLSAFVAINIAWKILRGIKEAIFGPSYVPVRVPGQYGVDSQSEQEPEPVDMNRFINGVGTILKDEVRQRINQMPGGRIVQHLGGVLKDEIVNRVGGQQEPGVREDYTNRIGGILKKEAATYVKERVTGYIR